VVVGVLWGGGWGGGEARGATVVARLSGHPAFKCVYLQSLQYTHPS